MCMKCGHAYSGAQVIPRAPHLTGYFGEGGGTPVTSERHTSAGWPFLMVILMLGIMGLTMGFMANQSLALGIACFVGLVSLVLIRRRSVT